MILIPENYQPDSEETRKETKLKYKKMYDEKYVESLIKQVETLSDSLQVAIADSKNRGTQRCAIMYIRKAHDIIRKFKNEIPTGG